MGLAGGSWRIAKKTNCAFGGILAAAGIASGHYAALVPSELARRQTQDRADVAKRARQAQRLWQDALPIGGTLGETYLRERGISCSLPESLRFLASCWHPSAQRFPAMLAQVEGAEGSAVHRTYLAPNGQKAHLSPAKLMLGPVSGGAVRLHPADYEDWLTGGPDAAFALIRPFPAEQMVIHQSGEGLKSDRGGL